MAVLIAGLGYIGSALARRLLADGGRVIAVENFFSTPKQFAKTLAGDTNFTLIEGSVDDPETIERAFAAAAVETVFYLAAQASADPTAAPLRYTVATNFLGAQRFLEACADHDVSRVILASSTRLYAPPLPGIVSERSPIYSPDLVHLSHLFAETLLRALHQQRSAWRSTTTAVRIGTAHGVGPVMKQDPRFLAVPQRFCRQAAHGETLEVDVSPASRLAFAQLDDVVSGLVHCAQLDAAPPLVNLAAEIRRVADVAAIVQRFARERGREVTVEMNGRVRGGGKQTVTSALDATGFRARRTLEDSLGAVLDYYLESP